MKAAATTITTQGIIDLITEAGLDYCRYECALAARNINLGLALGHRVNVWEQIAEMARRGIAGMDEAFDQAWALSGLPMDADRMDEAA